jgi:hypothetical protein
MNDRLREQHVAAACAPEARLVAVQLLLEFAPLLRFERQRGRGPRQQARNADRVAGLFAEAVVAAVDARERLLDLLQQLALAVAGTQFERVLFLDRGAISCSRYLKKASCASFM